jgi:L-threonylcarbamoyladenylate synthase
MRDIHHLFSATITSMSIISSNTATGIKDAAITLIKGDLVAFPTETVYGLGADATNMNAVRRIYTVKGRPEGHPVIVHISSIEHLDKWAREIPKYAVKLATAFWPGPMTLILPRTDLAKDFITGGQDNVGIRVPAHTGALSLLKAFEYQGGFGVAAPSANRFGNVSPTTASAVEIELGKYLNHNDKILNGGPCTIGIESTIIDCTKSIPSILRPGVITKKMIELTIGPSYQLIVNQDKEKQIKVPGLLASHYSPKAQIILNGLPSPGDGLIAPASIPTEKGIIRLASPKDAEEYARVLYEAYREGDNLKLNKIYIIAPEGDGIEIAIYDRIKKSSFKNN